METEQIKRLVESFFKNIKCESIWENNLLLISKVPQDFEKLYEKSSPYIFAFDAETHAKNADSEIITKGSILLKLITAYLENKAQTTLLRIKFEPDLKEIVKNSIDFKDYQIINIIKEIKNEYIFRFIFQTTMQYLNEKEQLITPVYIRNNEVLDNFNVDNFETLAGKKEDAKKELLEQIKLNYNLAKETLKQKLKPKTIEITNELNKSLEKGLERINLHYAHMVEEIEKEHQKNKDALENSKAKIIRANEKNRPIIEERIKRLEETIKNSTIDKDKEKLEKEKFFFINDEKQKNSINLNNSLMNTTIIYYPVFNFKILLKSKTSLNKEIKISYNPIKNELSKIFCESCKKEINEINICETGHLSCFSCMTNCPRCGKKICNSCKKLACNICGGRICSKCATLCSRCLRYTCNSDIRKDSITGKNICSGCTDFCMQCSKFSDKTSFKQCESCRKKFCSNCIKIKYTCSKPKHLCRECMKMEESKVRLF